MSSNQMSMKDYTVKKVIGEGAYGRAILCKENKSEDLVVIKEIAMANLSPQEQRDARKETKILACLHHPNIIGYRGSFTSNNTLHIVMDYADNGDLFTAIQNAKGVHFKEDQILDWFVQITLALKHIHDRKILHRDIKCQNIFLMKNGMIKMGDFGIAKILDHTTQFSKTAIGTPYYLSPEICEGKAYNAKSDIWSLGCVLYELCTLNHAFDSNCMNGLIMKILRAKHAPIPYYYSPQLRNLVDSLLNKNAQRRPSANQILKLDFIRARIGNLLSETIMKIEFSHTVFHKVKGGVTPKIDVKELPAISEEPKQKVNNAPKVLQKPEPKQSISRNAQPRSSNNAKPASKLPVSQAKAAPKAAAPPPKREPAKVKVDVPKPVAKPIRNPAVAKVPSKEDLVHQKNQMVIAERNQQKLLKEQRDAEAKKQEEIEKQKRREVEKKAEERAKARKAEFERLKAEDKARKAKFSKLEAPFKKMQEEAMAAPSKPRAKPPSRGAAPAHKPSTPSEGSDDTSSRDPSPKGPSKVSHSIPRSDSGEEPKNVTARPGKVKRREDEVRDIREMIKRRRAELRAQAKAEKEGFIKIGGVEIPADIPKEEPKPAPAPEKKPEPPKQEVQRVVEKKPEPAKQEAPEPKKEEKPPAKPEPPKKSVEELINMSSSDDEDNEENDLLELAAIAKSIFDNPPDDDEGEEENEDGQPTPQPETPPGKFIFNGKELVLKHVSGDDSLSYRVEALRQFIEEGLSLDTFLAMYQLLTEDSDHMSNEEIDKQIHSLLKTPEQLAYYPLLNQLISCEDSLNHQEDPR